MSNISKDIIHNVCTGCKYDSKTYISEEEHCCMKCKQPKKYGCFTYKKSKREKSSSDSDLDFMELIMSTITFILDMLTDIL